MVLKGIQILIISNFQTSSRIQSSVSPSATKRKYKLEIKIIESSWILKFREQQAEECKFEGVKSGNRRCGGGSAKALLLLAIQIRISI